MFRCADDVVAIVGAGISFESPTQAPGFKGIRNAYLRQCGFRKLVEEEEGEDDRERWLDIDHLSPEQIFNALDDGRKETKRQIRQDLWWLCETRGPNRNHKAVAKLIAAGAKVWTPNYDTMIERCAIDGQKIRAITDPEDFSSGAQMLMKPHGSFPETQGEPEEEPKPHDYDLLFSSSEVWQLSPAWKSRLEEDCRDRDVYLFGYRGADPDLTPAILAAAGQSRSTTWWECNETNFARLAGFVDRAHIQLVDGNPSTALRELAAKHAGFIDEAAAPDDPASAEKELKVEYRPTLASRAGLAGALSAANTARWLRLRALISEEDPKRRKVAAIRLLRSAGYDWAWARGAVAFSFSRAMTRSGQKVEYREGMAVLYLSLIDSRPLRRSDAKAISRVRDLGLGGSAATAIRVASIEKLHGNLETAKRDAERAMHEVEDEPLLEGMIAYNLAWIYRQQGDFGKRRTLIKNVEDLYAHFGPNWSAWIALDNALFAINQGHANEAETMVKGPFVRFVSSSIGHPAFLQDAETARTLLIWHQKGADHAKDRLDRELRSRPVSRILPPRYSSITTLLLIADNARARGDLVTTRRCLRQARHRASSRLQQAQIDLAGAFADHDTETLRRVEDAARRDGFGLIASTADAARAALDGRSSSTELLVDPTLPLPALY
jgi:hypothetical protein